METIPGTPGAGVSVSAPGPVSGAAGTLTIPAGSAPSTTGPTKGDGIFTPVGNREIYMKISTDYQEVVRRANIVNDGKPLPAGELFLLYEAGMHARIGVQSRTMRLFAREYDRAGEFPESVAYYKTPYFLDTEINDAIAGARTAMNYTPQQKAQAITKGMLRVIYHWARRYIDRPATTFNSAEVEESWSVYVGEEQGGKYPNSLAAVAQQRETEFKRPGAIDTPLRTALVAAFKAAIDKNGAAYQTAKQDVYSRYHTLFYLSVAKAFNDAVKAQAAGKAMDAGAAQVEALSWYLFFQPDVAKADAAVDKVLVDILKGDASKLTTANRDEVLTQFSKVAGAVFIKPADLVTAAALP